MKSILIWGFGLIINVCLIIGWVLLAIWSHHYVIPAWWSPFDVIVATWITIVLIWISVMGWLHWDDHENYNTKFW